MTLNDRPSHWPTVAAGGLGWALLASASLAAPWFVVFAVIIWIAAPVVALLLAGLAALAPALRPRASAIVRGVAITVALAVIPSALVVWGALAQMNDNYF